MSVVSLYPLLQSKLAWELKLYPGLENEKFPYAGRESTRGGQLRSVHRVMQKIKMFIN